MPEGPEVKIIADTLNSVVGDHGYIIEHISIEPTSKYHVKAEDGRRFSGIDFKPVIGRELGSIVAYGKKILFTIVSDIGPDKDAYPVIISSLGLEGHWIIMSDYEKALKYPHVSFIFSLRNKIHDGSRPDLVFLVYADSRHFGLLSIAKDRGEYAYLMKDVGRSWLQDSITFEEFYSKLSNKRFSPSKRIVDFLVEQKYFSGIGNYMRSEILYLAGISPHRVLSSIGVKDARKIYDSIFVVIDAAIKANGHTLHSYFTPLGKEGGYVPIIYGRKITNDSAKAVVISEKDSNNRMYHWAPSVQV